jgi:hypothetical protein
MGVLTLDHYSIHLVSGLRSDTEAQSYNSHTQGVFLGGRESNVELHWEVPGASP